MPGGIHVGGAVAIAGDDGDVDDGNDDGVGGTGIGKLVAGTRGETSFPLIKV